MGDEADLIFSKRRCCFWVLDSGHYSGSPESVWWGRIRKAESDDRWWKRGWRRVREWSELVAGPRWKTFIRRFKKKVRGGGKQSKFQYDPLSYALNFDEGQMADMEDDGGGYKDFSSRYAPASAKSSMDLGSPGLDFVLAPTVARV
ncbi:hypothetical protein H6P81_008706 [Aristolochia fimbriata]|uniref:Uncharacterized protein n=1 Tax=Aristolochia fimbriata TaxID=158543 RepID=A0AAV7EM44_ARIFI|nr:hypothetical protein H6P81_008706 [Aristolochia fimbriata]